MNDLTPIQKIFYFVNISHQFYREKINLGDHILTHLNIGQGKILNILVDQSPISQKDLVAQLDMKPQSASELLQKLEKKGFITREKSETDKRVMIVTLTKHGLATTNPHDSSDLLLDALTPEEQQQLDVLLTKMIKHIEPELRHEHHHPPH
ncbi:MAG TPA: MarR family transcriptional regulator [Lactobacillaceae bacterium]|jgi:DNA-binding MarR family transcriptional regulator